MYDMVLLILVGLAVAIGIVNDLNAARLLKAQAELGKGMDRILAHLRNEIKAVEENTQKLNRIKIELAALTTELRQSPMEPDLRCGDNFLGGGNDPKCGGRGGGKP